MCGQNKNAPLVTVIMPAYNAASYIAESIESVRSQTVSDWELLIIDDCSNDDSFKIAQSYADHDDRIKVMRNETNSGVALTRNRGIAMANGSFIAFLDSDDVWYPEKLNRQLECMERTNAGISYCSYAIVDRNGKKCKADYLVSDSVTYRQLLKKNCMQCSAMLIRAEILKKIPFNTEFYHEDFVLGLDILHSGVKAAGCPEVLLAWRYIQNSRSFDKRKSAINRWKIYRSYLNLPLLYCMYLFVCYTVTGLRKYLRKGNFKEEI